MLVLSRRRGEELVIGDDVRVRVLEIRGNVVKLGFTAPDDVRIQRHEVLVRLSDEMMAELAGV
jgi:carbon storage regulator